MPHKWGKEIKFVEATDEMIEHEIMSSPWKNLIEPRVLFYVSSDYIEVRTLDSAGHIIKSEIHKRNSSSTN